MFSIPSSTGEQTLIPDLKRQATAKAERNPYLAKRLAVKVATR